MLYESEAGDITLALTGDSMLSRRLAIFKEERYLRLCRLLRDADVAFTNLESTVHAHGEGTPAISVGTYMTTEPELLEDLKWMGINLVSAANNHAFDWTEEGVMLTVRYLDAAGLAHAGTGGNLREATRPAYLDTPKGRVALIAANSMFDPPFRATHQRVDVCGKPGMNVVGFEKSYVVDRQTFEELRRAGAGLGFDAERQRQRNFGFFSASEVGGSTETAYAFLGSRFVLGDGFRVHTAVNEHDAAENLRQVREARRQADWVIFSMHYHEMGGKALYTATRRTELEEPPEFVVDFAHRCIDEGVDVFVGHGPHVALGLEIYKGKPVFYSLGDFILQNETVQVFPSHAYDRFRLDPMSTPADFLDTRSDQNRKAHPGDPLFWEAFVPVCRFGGGALKEIQLYPVDAGHGRPRAQRGRPLLADDEISHKILARLARISEHHGTRIESVDGVGRVAGL